MKSFLRDIALFAFVQIALLACTLGLFYDPDRTHPVYAAAGLKNEHLARAAQPRIVLVGGSNLFYGIESERIEARTGRHPVNMGLVGGLRLGYTLREALAGLQSGDLVVLALEYFQLLEAHAEEVHPVLLARLLEQRPASAGLLSATQWRALSDRGLQEHVGEAFRSAVDTALWGPRPYPGKLPVVNRYGDLISYRSERPGRGRDQIILRTDLSGDVVRENIALLAEFSDAAARLGARVVLSFPPLPAAGYESRRARVEAMRRAVEAGVDIPILGRQTDFLFAPEVTIGDSYHLWGAGVRDRTDRLIDSLAPYLE